MAPSNCQGDLAASPITCPVSIYLVPTMPASSTPPSSNVLNGTVKLPGRPGGVPNYLPGVNLPGPHHAGIEDFTLPHRFQVEFLLQAAQPNISLIPPGVHG